MGRMKTFGKYLLLLVAFYIVSSIMAFFAIKTTYADMSGNIATDEYLQINVDEAKSTMVNGYVTGTLKNKTEQEINSKYVKIEFYSAKKNKILTEYIKIDELAVGESKKFTVNFRGENIKSFNVIVTGEYSNEESEMHLINLKDAENEPIKKISIFIAAAILIKYFIL